MLTNVQMMFARTRPNVGTHMDHISVFAKMDGRVKPVIKVKQSIFFYFYVIHSIASFLRIDSGSDRPHDFKFNYLESKLCL